MAPEQSLIAPCGMDCALCAAFQRKRDECDGCRNHNATLTSARSRCVVRNCAVLRTNSSGFCYECGRFPCARMRQLDARYRRNYGMSMIGNLGYIRENGMAAFLERERERWTCAACGALVCVHRDHCLRCGAPYRRGTPERDG